MCLEEASSDSTAEHSVWQVPVTLLFKEHSMCLSQSFHQSTKVSFVSSLCEETLSVVFVHMLSWTQCKVSIGVAPCIAALSELMTLEAVPDWML